MGLTKEDIEHIGSVLKGVDFLQHMTPGEAGKLIAGFEKTTMKQGDVLITQGKTGSIFYIVASGEVGVYLKRAWVDKKVATLGAGKFFGELALINDEPRNASVICEADGEVFTLLRDTFQNVIMHNPHLSEEIKRIAHQRQMDTKNLQLGEATRTRFR
jgi:CRP-like cAMP-binding protein